MTWKLVFLCDTLYIHSTSQFHYDFSILFVNIPFAYTGFPDITEIVNNQKYDMKIHIGDPYLIINFQYVFRSLRGNFEFGALFSIAHFHLLPD